MVGSLILRNGKIPMWFASTVADTLAPRSSTWWNGGLLLDLQCTCIYILSSRQWHSSRLLDSAYDKAKTFSTLIIKPSSILPLSLSLSRPAAGQIANKSTSRVTAAQWFCFMFVAVDSWTCHGDRGFSGGMEERWLGYLTCRVMNVRLCGWKRKLETVSRHPARPRDPGALFITAQNPAGAIGGQCSSAF